MKPLMMLATAMTLLTLPAVRAHDKAGTDSTALGSADFYPSPDRPVSWRGDRTGKYPGATPPLTWSRTAKGASLESQNIVWMTPLPGGSAGSPIVVGDKIIVNADVSRVLCINKADGKILWMKNETLYDTLTDDERKALKEKCEPLIVKLKALNEQFVAEANAAVSPSGMNAEKRKALEKIGADSRKLETEIIFNLQEANPEKFGRKGHWLQQWGTSSQVPCSDGVNVYAAFGLGLSAAFDLKGNRQWIVFNHVEAGEHGLHESPILIDGKFICTFHHSLYKKFVTVARDAKTGAELWQSETSGTFAPGMAGNARALVDNNGIIVRVSDGHVLVPNRRLFNDFPWVPPVTEDNVAYCFQGKPEKLFKLVALKFPEKDQDSAQPDVLYAKDIPYDFDKAAKKSDWDHFYVASVLCHDGLAYMVTEGKAMLTVADLKTGAAVYQTALDMHPRIAYVSQPGVCASPTLAGKYVYCMDNNGTTIVFEAGRQFKQIARNVTEEPYDGVNVGQTVGCPVFDGHRMYFRSQEYLYGVGEK